MKKIVTYIVVVAIGWFVINAVIDSRRRAEIEEIEAAARAAEAEAAIAQFSSRYNAVADWVEKLSHGRGLLHPVLTIELEPYWLTERPILFEGTINDVATYDDQHYTIRIRQTFLQNIEFFMGTEFRLRLLAGKEEIDKLLKDNPDIMSPFNLMNSLIVVAQIDSILAETTLENGYEREVKVGKGTLLDLLYMGNF